MSIKECCGLQGGNAALQAIPLAGTPCQPRPDGRRRGGQGPERPYEAQANSFDEKRLAGRGFHAIPDGELLAHILTVIADKEDAGRLADHLLSAFEGLADVAAAPRSRLKEVGRLGDGAVLTLRIIWELAARLAWNDAVKQPVLSSASNLLTYCHVRLAREQVDQVRLLLLDSEGRLVADALHQTGTVGQVEIYPREVVRTALDMNAAQFIIARGQVATRARLSGADRAYAKTLDAVGQALGIPLFDYLVIGRDGHASYRESQGSARHDRLSA